MDVRLALGYLGLSVVIWLATWVQWWIGLPCVAIVVGLEFALLWRVPLSYKPNRDAIIAAAIAGAWVLATNSGGVAYGSNGDWTKHLAILGELVNHDWPVYLEGGLLRYYIGLYLPAAAASKLGLYAGYAISLWIWLGLAIGIYMLKQITKSSWILLSIVLIGFSGMDIARLGFENTIGRPWWATHLERSTFSQLEYSSFTTGLNWVPHHLISALLGVGIWLRTDRDHKYVGLLCLFLVFWSVFVALGLLLLHLLVGHREILRMFNRYNVVALLPSIPVLLYLTAHAPDAPTGVWLLNWMHYPEDWPFYVPTLSILWRLQQYITFVSLEFGILAVMMFLVDPKLIFNRYVVSTILLLLLLPILAYGAFNDFTMRVATPALILFFIWVVKTFETPKPRAMTVVLTFILLLGLATPSQSIMKSILQGPGYNIDHRIYTAQNSLESAMYLMELQQYRTIDETKTFNVGWPHPLPGEPGRAPYREDPGIHRYLQNQYIAPGPVPFVKR